MTRASAPLSGNDRRQSRHCLKRQRQPAQTPRFTPKRRGVPNFSASSVNGTGLNIGGFMIPTSDGSMSTGGIGGGGSFSVSYVHC